MPLWLPSNITDGSLDLWFDGSDSSTIAVSGSNVTTWTDKAHSVAATNLRGTTATNAAPTQNGLAGLHFPGGSLGNSSTTRGNVLLANSLFMVADFTTASKWQVLFGGYRGASGDQNYGIANSASPCPLYIGISGVSNSNSSTTLAISTPALIEFVTPANSGGNCGPSVPYLNGNVGGTIAALASSATETGFQIGSDYAVDGLVGNIWEVIFLNVQVGTLNRQLIEGYLCWKWGLNASLPSGHPYKNAAPRIGDYLGSPGDALPIQVAYQTAINYRTALVSTTEPTFVSPIHGTLTPKTLFFPPFQERPFAPDKIGTSLRDTTQPVQPRAPPVTTTQTPSFWVQNPDCTLPDQL